MEAGRSTMRAGGGDVPLRNGQIVELILPMVSERRASLANCNSGLIGRTMTTSLASAHFQSHVELSGLATLSCRSSAEYLESGGPKPKTV